MFKLITHTDLDGVSCAILAKIAWKDNVDVSFCYLPSDVNASLLKLAKEEAWKKYNVVFITDLSFNVEILEQLGKLQGCLKLFDHHLTTIESFHEFPWACVHTDIDRKLTCGTELFYRYLQSKHLVGNRDYYVEQVRQYDTWDWYQKENRIPKYLSDVVNNFGLQYFYKTYLERLSVRDVNELNIFNQYERDILLFEEAREQKDIDMFIENSYICDIYSDVISPNKKKFKIGVVFNSSLYSSALGNSMCRQLDVDIAFLVNLNKEKIEVRTAKEDINLNRLMKEYFRGGGHQKAAGGFIGNVTDSIIRNLLSGFCTVYAIEKAKKQDG